MGAHFLSNLSLLGFVFAIWFLIGLGPLFAILPTRGLRSGIFLAPLLGCVFMASLGLYRIGIFFWPVHSVVQATVLMVLSLCLVLIFRSKWTESGAELGLRGLWRFLFIPMLYSLFFSGMFSRGGYELLSGSQDELRYSSIADHIHLYVHTGSPDDVPMLRADHWVYDYPTRLYAYAQNYRRGAELTLEHTLSWTGLSAEESFPLTIGVAFLSLLCALVFLGRFAFGFTVRNSLLLQGAFASASYFMVMHIQGCLANLCSVGIFLSAICLAENAFAQRSWRWALLAGIFAGGTFIFYSEVVLILWCAPVFWVAGESLFRSQANQRKRVFAVFGVLSGALILVASVGLFAFYKNLVDNLSHAAQTIFHPVVQTYLDKAPLLIPTHWMPVAVLYGLSSWFDPSYFTSLSNRLFISHSIASVTIIFLCFLIGLLGFLRAATNVSRAFALVLGILTALVFLNFMKHDDFLLYRSTGYSLPFVFIGMVRFVDEWGKNLGKSQKSVRLILESACVSLCFALWVFNLNITMRTAHYLRTHDVSTDHIIRRLNPNAYVWRKLRDELKPSWNTPVLITGFQGITVSNWIVNAIHPIPHFLGTGERSSIWGLITEPGDYPPVYASAVVLGTRLDEKRLNKLLVIPNWNIELSRFIRNSRQAIVPPHGDFPSDWEKWKDVYSNRRVQFPNIGDVIYKKQMMVTLDPNRTGPLRKDAHGLFREVLGSSKMLVNDMNGDCFRYRIIYDGKPGDLKIRSGDQEIKSNTVSGPLSTEVSGDLSYEEVSGLELIRVSSIAVKLRLLDWNVVQCGG